ncbi:hypothetical protein BSKO_00556 [Bryopsis sp. KO-2023]|nr:hypothetical protein BSKO_00556 [Bryopsis sp. KO-2023]
MQRDAFLLRCIMGGDAQTWTKKRSREEISQGFWRIVKCEKMIEGRKCDLELLGLLIEKNQVRVNGSMRANLDSLSLIQGKGTVVEEEEMVDLRWKTDNVTDREEKNCYRQAVHFVEENQGHRIVL